jgi:hypothetical protein
MPAKRRTCTRRAAFLAAYSVCGQITKAAKAARIDRDMHYQWLKGDPEYPALFEDARMKAVQALEDEAVRRATEGVFEPNQYQGQFVYPIKGYEKDPETGRFRKDRPIFGKKPLGVMKKSDRLLEFLLRAGKPEKFRERAAVEVTGADGGPLEIIERLQAGRKRVADAKRKREEEEHSKD